MDISARLILLLAPIVLLQIALLVWALLDLMKPERRVKGGNKVVWLLVVLLINVIGPLVYLFLGREED